MYDEALDSDDLRVALVPASKILDHAFHKAGIEQSIEMANRAAPEIEQRDRRRLLLGELMEMTLAKKQRYGLQAPELDRLEEELKTRMAAEVDCRAEIES